MSITRAQAESELISRIGKLFTELEMDGTTVNGTNADLNGPLGYAARQCDLTVADLTAVTSTDLAGLSSDNLDLFLDLAELRALENALRAARRLVTVKAGPLGKDLSDIADGLKEDIAMKKASIADLYGFGGGSLEAGVLQLDIIQSNDDVMYV